MLRISSKTTLITFMLSAMLAVVNLGCDSGNVLDPGEEFGIAMPTAELDAGLADRGILAAPADELVSVAELPLTATAVASYTPDLAAHRIDFKIIRRYSDFRGRVRISGVIKNMGRQPFRSSALAVLMEVVPRTRGRTIATREITYLAPGATMSLSYERNWYSAPPAEGEFPPTYVLYISYDPDSVYDGLDANWENNWLERSGADINDMFATSR